MNHREGRIAIIGCGRSGTTYTSKLFKKAGYSLGHETLERHGISSWYATPNTWRRCFGPAQKELRLLNIPRVHQVRHPINAISSVATFKEKSWDYVARYIPIEPGDSVLLRSMKYWYYWNLLAEECSLFTYQVEQINSSLGELLRVGGFDRMRFDDALLESFPKNVNRRDHGSLTWDNLKTENPELADRIRELSRKYGY